jgi:hypothetical protein
VDPEPIRSGEFRWLWYKLIPTNVEIIVFRLEPFTHTFRVKNTLPSGDTYAAFAGASADFSWEMSASLSFSISPEALVTLVADNTIGSQEALVAWENSLAERIGAMVMARLSSGETDTRRLEEILKTGVSAELERDIQGQFPLISGFSCVVTTAKFPDFALYNQVRSLFEDFIARQRDYMAGALNQKAEDRIDSRFRFDELEHYGELLSKYPVLLEYLALERGNRAKSE